MVLFSLTFYGQNVGIGTNTPAAKLHVNETTDTTGFKITMSSATNNNSAAKIENAGLGHALEIVNSNAGATSLGDGLVIINQGAGEPIDLLQYGTGSALRSTTYNTSNAATAWYVDHTGTGDGITANVVGPSAYGIKVSATGANGRGVYSSASGGSSAYAFEGVAGGGGFSFVGTGSMWVNGNMGCSGAKPFTIDYPLDPANMQLRHYALESNEVLNVYRGIIMLDTNGKAEIELPVYFDAVNINPSYQLTAIGTPQQPYILSEINGNKFEVAGVPDTKVSWIVYANRNDPTYRYHDKNGGNYSEEVTEKSEENKGKYLTPAAYGADSKQSMYPSQNTPVTPADHQ